MDDDVTTFFAVDENGPTASGRSGKLIIVRSRGRAPEGDTEIAAATVTSIDIAVA